MLTNMMLATLVAAVILAYFVYTAYKVSKLIPDVQRLVDELVKENSENLVFGKIVEDLANASFNRYDIFNFLFFSLKNSLKNFSIKKQKKQRDAIIEAAEFTEEQVSEINALFAKVYLKVQMTYSPIETILALLIFGVIQLTVQIFRLAFEPTINIESVKKDERRIPVVSKNLDMYFNRCAH